MTITLYTTDRCAQCQATKRQLRHCLLDFTEINIDRDTEARGKVMALGYSAAPVVIFEDGAGTEHWSGFRPDRIIALSKKKAA